MYDLALLQVNSYNGPVLITIGEPIPEGKVYAIGFLQKNLNILKGNPVTQNSNINYQFFTNISYMGGTSGSPVFNSKKQVIGILSRGIDVSIIATKAGYLTDLLLNTHDNNTTERNNKLFQQEIKQTHQLATHNREAQYVLGRLYYSGIGVKKNEKKAIEYFTQSAEQNYPEAQSEIGVIHYERQNYEKTIKYFTSAAKKGHLISELLLGMMCYLGEGEERDYYKARKQFTSVAEQGHPIAQFMLGMMCYLGEGGERDYYKARKQFTSAAEQGYSEALQAIETLGTAESYIDKIYWAYRSLLQYFSD